MTHNSSPITILHDSRTLTLSRCRKNKRLAGLELAAWVDVADVFEYERTTSRERDDILSRWLGGEVGFYLELADKRRLSPLALIAACLIDSEHPVFCPEGNPVTGSLLSLFVLIYCVEIVRMNQPTIQPEILAAGILSCGNLWKPVDKSIKSVDNFQKSVDKSVKYVDNFVDKPVDKYASYQQYDWNSV